MSLLFISQDDFTVNVMNIEIALTSDIIMMMK